MLGPEKQILADYVADGRVKIIFWPLLELGPNSHDSAAAAMCAGEQDPMAFWRYHNTLFENQFDLYLAGRDHYVEIAAALGLDQAAFETCFDGGAAHDLATTLDQNRRDRGIFSRPTFTIAAAGEDGDLLIGAQPYEAFAAAIEARLGE